MVDYTVSLSDSILFSDRTRKIYNNVFVYDDHRFYNFDSEGISRVVDYSRSVSELVAVVDSITEAVTKFLYLTEQIFVTDSVLKTVSFARALSDTSSIADYISYLYSNTVDGGEAPEIDVFDFSPLSYVDLSAIVVSPYQIQQTVQASKISSQDQSVLKIYDSHTIYNKHIPYYAAIGTDEAPTILTITEL